MSDQGLRTLERQASTGDPQAQAAYQRALERAGIRSPRYWMTGKANAISQVRHLVGSGSSVVVISSCGLILLRDSWPDFTGGMVWTPMIETPGGHTLDVSPNGRFCKTCQKHIRAKSFDDNWLTLWANQIVWAEARGTTPYPGSHPL